MTHQNACKNTDREIWRETPEDYYAPSIHVTQGGSIGINVGGLVVVMDVRDWHRIAAEQPAVMAANGENAFLTDGLKDGEGKK